MMNLQELKALIRKQLEESFYENNTSIPTAIINKKEVNKSQDLNSKLKSDIKYLKDFNFVSYKNEGNNYGWKFKFITNNDSYMVNFTVLNKNGLWYGDLDVFWKKKTKNSSEGTGKDNDIEFGPYDSYERMIEELNRKLHNNPVFSTEVFKDDYVHGLDEEIVKLLEDIKEKGEDLSNRNHANFKEIIEIYHKIKNLDDSKLMEFSKNEWPEEEDKMTAILNLQNVNKDGFYRDMAKMGNV